MGGHLGYLQGFFRVGGIGNDSRSRSVRIEDGATKINHLARDNTKGAFGVRISCIVNRFLSWVCGSTASCVTSSVVYSKVLLHGGWLGIAANAKCISSHEHRTWLTWCAEHQWLGADSQSRNGRRSTTWHPCVTCAQCHPLPWSHHQPRLFALRWSLWSVASP